MPLGKYYCDYCDKQFQDTPSARRRHLQGLHHLRSKAAWYDSFKEPNQAFTDGFGKGVCNRFVNTGFCQYGDSCRYFHPKNTLQNSTQGMAGLMDNNQFSNISVNPSVGGGSVFPGDTFGDGMRMGMTWGNLPPSLWPPPEGGYPPLPFVDWG